MLTKRKSLDGSKLLIPAAAGAGGFVLGTKLAEGLDSREKKTQGFVFAGVGLLFGLFVINPLLSKKEEEEQPEVNSINFQSDSQASSFAKGQQDSKAENCKRIQRENTKGLFKKARIRKRIRENCTNLA